MPELDSPPAAFDAYWNGVLQQLASTPTAPEEEWLPLRSGDSFRCYGVKLTSIGPYRIFAYLSIPKGPGPFPALYLLPRYLSVVEALTQGEPTAKRSRYVVFALAARGHRNADRPFTALFPGLLTEAIDDPQRYVYRGIVADCVRGLEYLLSRPEVDPTRVAALGHTELPLLTAALLPRVSCLTANPGLFYRARELAPQFDAYPQEELNDYCRAFPDRANRLFDTLTYFDARHFAPRIQAPALLWAACENAPWDVAELEPLRRLMPGPVETRQSTGSTYQDGMYREAWLTRHLGTEPILPEAWQL